MTPAAETAADAEGEPVLRDGHGNRLYDVDEDTAALHRDAVAAGWRHTYDLTPYRNLRALVEVLDREGIAADRRLVAKAAFKFVCGYGPNSTPLALDRLGVTHA